MPALHIRNVDDAVIDALKRRAQENHRSLEGELRELLEQIAFSKEAPARRSRKRKLRLSTVSVGSKSSYDRDEIYAPEESGAGPGRHQRTSRRYRNQAASPPGCSRSAG